MFYNKALETIESSKTNFSFFSTFQQYNSSSYIYYILLIPSLRDPTIVNKVLLIFFFLFPMTMIAQESDAVLGEEYYQKGDYEKALVFFEKYLKKERGSSFGL